MVTGHDESTEHKIIVSVVDRSVIIIRMRERFEIVSPCSGKALHHLFLGASRAVVTGHDESMEQQNNRFCLTACFAPTCIEHVQLGCESSLNSQSCPGDVKILRLRQVAQTI